MSLDEEALEVAAKGGMMDFEKWQAMVEPLLDRLEHIVYNVFPMPKAPPEQPSPFNHFRHPASHQLSSQLQDANSIPSSSNKENAYPPDLQTPPRPTMPSTADTSERVPDSQPQSFSGPSNNSLPAPLMLLLNSIRSTIRSYFASKPPHTVQRLAELILHPNAHYRTLPAYLRAVDRVITVTSSADNFPLQMQACANQANGLMNGEMSDHGISGDESLGGALLTPIPWLDDGSSFEDDGVTSLDQGLVPNHDSHGQEAEPAQSAFQPHSTATATAVENETGADRTSPSPENSEEIPHARGPPVVGVEDMGLQDGKGVEIPLSNVEGGPEGQPVVHGGQDQAMGEADGDGDILLKDVTDGGEREETDTGAASGTADVPMDTERRAEQEVA